MDKSSIATGFSLAAGFSTAAGFSLAAAVLSLRVGLFGGPWVGWGVLGCCEDGTSCGVGRVRERQACEACECAAVQ